MTDISAPYYVEFLPLEHPILRIGETSWVFSSYDHLRQALACSQRVGGFHMNAIATHIYCHTQQKFLKIRWERHQYSQENWDLFYRTLV